MFQHVVAQSYLRPFADATNRVKVIEQGKLLRHPRSIRKVGGEEFFYSVLTADGGLDHRIEVELLQRTDKIGGDLLQRLCGGDFPLLGSERSTFASYLALQITRSHAYRDASEWMDAQRTGARQRHLEQYAVEMLRPVGHLTDVLANMRWRLVTFSDDCLFTSDAPLVCWNRERGADGRNTPMDADEVRYPLTPRSALVLCWADTPRDERCHMGGAGARKLRWSVAEMAWMQVLCPVHVDHTVDTGPAARGPLFPDSSRAGSRRRQLVLSVVRGLAPLGLPPDWSAAGARIIELDTDDERERP